MKGRSLQVSLSSNILTVLFGDEIKAFTVKMTKGGIVTGNRNMKPAMPKTFAHRLILGLVMLYSL